VVVEDIAGTTGWSLFLSFVDLLCAENQSNGKLLANIQIQ
jgi:hypothetical protein